MRTQWKVLALVFVVLATTLIAVIWKTQALVVEDKRAFVADSSTKQAAPLRRLVDAKLAEAQRELVRFAASRALNGAGRETDFGPFEVVALIEAHGGQNSPTWIERGATAKPEAWPQGHDLALLKSIPYLRVKDGQRHWIRQSDARGGPVFAVVVSVEVKTGEEPTSASSGTLPDAVNRDQPTKSSRSRAYIVGFTSGNPLAAMTEDFIGSVTNVYIVDDRGYVASHVDKSYVGALFSEDPVVAEIVKSQRAIGTGEYEDLESRPVLGHYEKVDDSNLTVVIATPMRAIRAAASEHLSTAVFTSIFVGLICLALTWYLTGRALASNSGSSGIAFDSREDEDDFVATQAQRESPAPAEIPVTKAIVAAPPPVAAVEPAELQNERKRAFEAFQQDLASRLRNPILSILGNVQLIKANGDASVREYVDKVEREARIAKEALDRIRMLEETEAPLDPNETFDLDDVVAGTLAERAIDLEAAGIGVERNILGIPRLKGRASDFEVAVQHLIDNAVEAMKDRSVRRLSIKTEERDGSACLVIGDTGIGMARDVKARAFEPFFKKFDSPLRMGLGLSFVHAAAHRADAVCEIDSAPGEGTIVTIKFPIQARKTPALETPPPLEASPEEAYTPTVPSKPPPPGLSAEERAAQIEANVQRLLSLGGRGPIAAADALPPAPYPKLDREEPSEPSVVTGAISFERPDFVDQTEIPTLEPEVQAIPDSFIETPIEPEAPMTSIEAAPEHKPFRVRIRPPRTRGPSSQA